MRGLRGMRLDDRQRAAASTMVGTTVEWYDFFIYGTAAGLVFGEVFFGNLSPVAGTIMAYVVFAIGYLSRPIGSIVFGHYGDTIGRRKLMILAVLIMGIATILIGCLPGSSQIGIAAPILLIILRLCQGIAVGGEWGGAVVMAFEHAPPGRRGLWASFPQMGQPAGLGLGTAVFLIMGAMLTPEQFQSWGWRVPFLFSIFVVGAGLWIRLKLAESPEFEKMAESGDVARRPLTTMLTDYWRAFLPAIGSRGAEAMLWNTIAVFSITYVATILELSKTVALTGILLGCVAQFFSVPVYGHLSDLIGRRSVHATALAILGVVAVPGLYYLQGQPGWAVILYLFVTIGVIYPAIFSAMAAWFGEQFPVKVRYTSVGMVYQISGMIYSAPTPIIATVLLTRSDNLGWWLFGGYIMAGTLLGLFCASRLRGGGGRNRELYD